MTSSTPPLFSPRNTAAKFNIVSPYRVAKNALDPATRPVAKLQLREAMRGLGTLAVTASLLSQIPGVEVGANPWGEGFGKVRVGQTVYDITGGAGHTLKYLARMAESFGELARGREVEAGKTPAMLTRRYLRSQLSPSASVAADYATGKTFDGKDFEWANVPADLLLPFVAADAYEGWVQHGGTTFTEAMQGKPIKTGVVGAVKTAPSFLGPGVRTYESGETARDLVAHAEAKDFGGGDPVALAELRRLRVAVKRVGKGYGVETVGGDKMRFSDESASMPKAKREELERKLHAAITGAVGREVRDPGYTELRVGLRPPEVPGARRQIRARARDE